MIVATHDLEAASRDYDLVACLNRRLVAFGPPGETATEQTLAETFADGSSASVRCSSTSRTTITARASDPSTCNPSRRPRPVEFLTDPFEAEFVRTGALAAALVGVMCGVVGCYVVLRGMALMADSLAHGVLPGIAIAFALAAGAAERTRNQLAITVGALAAGLVTAAATSLILRRSRLREDTAAAVAVRVHARARVAIVSRVRAARSTSTRSCSATCSASSPAEVVTTPVADRRGPGPGRACSIGPSCCCRSTASAPPRSGSRSTRCSMVHAGRARARGRRRVPRSSARFWSSAC